MKTKFDVADILRNKNGEVFKSGSAWDDEVVVISTEPFLCVSEGGDMLWTRLDERTLKFTGCKASEEQMKIYNRRLPK